MPTNSRYAWMQSCPAVRFGDLDLAHARVQGFHLLHDVSDEVGEHIHRFA
jgi:hypothetical protein